uniref:AAA family ATPase n=1 Tax=Ancylomarina sp. TaxID=1970196 RepID=UPI003564DC3C
LVESQEAVLFFDEFDSLGKERDYDNTDSNEMKRVVNTMLQLIDSLPKHSIIIAATNQIDMIDSALLRRFELKLEFRNPSNDLLDGFYDKLLAKYPEEYRQVDRKYDISFAEAQDIIFRTVKNNIIVSELKKKENLVEETIETNPCLN